MPLPPPTKIAASYTHTEKLLGLKYLVETIAWADKHKDRSALTKEDLFLEAERRGKDAGVTYRMISDISRLSVQGIIQGRYER